MLLCVYGLEQFSNGRVADFALRKVGKLEKIAQEIDCVRIP